MALQSLQSWIKFAEDVRVRLFGFETIEMTANNGLKLLSHFDVWTLAKGGDYYRAGKVRYVSSGSGGQIQALVEGSGKNEYSVMLILAADLSSVRAARCTCPVSSNCKHCVAVLRAYLDQQLFKSPDRATGAADRMSSDFSDGVASPGQFSRLQGRLGSSNQGTADSADRKIEGLDFDSPESHELSRRFELLSHTLKGSDTILTQSPPESKGSKLRNAIVYVVFDLPNKTEPCVEARKVTILADDSFGGESNLRIEKLTDYTAPKYMTDSDHEIVKLWNSVAYQGASSYYMQNTFGSDAELFNLLMNRIVASGKCYYLNTKGSPLKIGNPKRGKLRWRDIAEKRHLQLVAVDDVSEHVCLRWKFPWYFDQSKNEFGPLVHEFSEASLSAIYNVPPIEAKDLVSATVLFHDSGLDALVPPPTSDKVEVRYVSPKRSVSLRKLVSVSDAVVNGKFAATRGEALRVVALNIVEPPEVGIEVGTEGKIVITKLEPGSALPAATFEDSGFIQAPFHLFKDGDESELYFIAKDPVRWMAFQGLTEKLQNSGWDISPETLEAVKPLELDETDLEIKVEEDGNFWFSLSLTLDVDGQPVSLLPVLLAALSSLPSSGLLDVEAIESLNSNGKFVTPLSDGKIVSFPFERIRAILMSLQEMLGRDKNAKTLKTSMAQAQALFEPGSLKDARWVNADKMQELIQRLRSLQNIVPVDAPSYFLTKLRPYQMEGLGWLQTLAQQNFGGILADDMGLGKTIQLLAHVCLEKKMGRLTMPYLVICPTSVAPNWLAEARKFAPTLKLVNFTGADRFDRLVEIKDADLVVTSYPLVSRDFEKLQELQWHGVVLDEAQVIKNPDSQIASFVTQLKSNHRFCLTGTPIQNNLGELWSHFRFLAPGLLGDQSTFNKFLRNPIEKLGDVERQKILNGRIRPFILRRTKSEVASELPEKTIIIEPVELSEPQRDLYEAVRLASSNKIQDEIAKKGFKRSHIIILDALLKLRQVCCDPRLVKMAAAKNITKSAKLDLLIEKLIELAAESRKVLVFSQFTSMLDLIAIELEKNEIQYVQLRGDTKDRITPVETFQSRTVPVFLISLKAGGTGLNLTAADTVIHYDPWWNPAAEDQATDRAHRIGQAKHIFVYKLIAQGTIEQKMLDLQERKRELANSIFDATGNLGVGFDEHDLQDLLRPLDQ